MTRLEDALCAAGVGVDYLGFIFYEKSLRSTEPRAASNMIREVKAQFPDLRAVGVFVNESADRVLKVRELSGFDYVQLHGQETPEYCVTLQKHSIPVVKVIHIGAAGEPAWSDYDVEYYLCDTHDVNLVGGTGRTFDLNLVPPGLPLERCFIAGGLNPVNVASLLSEIRPMAVDVASGLEISPGVKSHELIRQFAEAVRKQ